MDVIIYHNPSCATSRNTLAMIRNAGIEPHVIEYLKTPPSRAMLEQLIARMSIATRSLLREKGTPYAALGLANTRLSDDRLLDAMLAHPILINRPIVVSPIGAALCRPSEKVLDLLPPQRGAFFKEDGERVVDEHGRRVAIPVLIFNEEEHDMTTTDVKETVRRTYSDAARRATAQTTCCGPSSCCGSSSDTAAKHPITSNLYEAAETLGLPLEAMLASLGCGNPTALAELAPGEIVLDLGSGGGIDVLLSARRVGPTGKAYGLDMTDEMLALARDNQRKAGVTNVEFLKGEIEHIPLPDSSVDVVISNCVINLSADKDQVLREVFRVLRPGGRFAVSDIVTRGEMPQQLRGDMRLWAGCIAGALEDTDYASRLATAGFTGIGIEPTRIYTAEDARDFLEAKHAGLAAIADQIAGKFMSAFVRATKPSPCCGCRS